MPWRAPDDPAPIVMPSKTRSAYSVRMARSLKVPGSPSSALQMTNFLSASVSAARLHLVLVGNPVQHGPAGPIV